MKALYAGVCLSLFFAWACGSADSSRILHPEDDGGASGGKRGGSGGSGGASSGGTAASSGGSSDGATGKDGGADASADGGAGGSDGKDGGPDASGSTDVATLFLPNSLTGVVYRYNVPRAGPVVLTARIPVEGANDVLLRPTGELLVNDSSHGAGNGNVFRFLSPLGVPVPNGKYTGLGLGTSQQMITVDDEVWIDNTADHNCTTEPQNIVRVSFDASGDATKVGEITAQLIGANRGMLFVPSTRELFVSQCSPVNVIQHYLVGADKSVTVLPAITGMKITNPHAMLMTDWGELLVVTNFEASILRFTRGDGGELEPNGAIHDPSLSSPVGMDFTPWGELLVGNQGSGVVSRFTFDADHVATSSGTIASNTPTIAGVYGIGWLRVVPGASIPALPDAGTP